MTWIKCNKPSAIKRMNKFTAITLAQNVQRRGFVEKGGMGNIFGFVLK